MRPWFLESSFGLDKCRVQQRVWCFKIVFWVQVLCELVVGILNGVLWHHLKVLDYFDPLRFVVWIFNNIPIDWHTFKGVWNYHRPVWLIFQRIHTVAHLLLLYIAALKPSAKQHRGGLLQVRCWSLLPGVVEILVVWFLQGCVWWCIECSKDRSFVITLHCPVGRRENVVARLDLACYSDVVLAKAWVLGKLRVVVLNHVDWRPYWRFCEWLEIFRTIKVKGLSVIVDSVPREIVDKILTWHIWLWVLLDISRCCSVEPFLCILVNVALQRA